MSDFRAVVMGVDKIPDLSAAGNRRFVECYFPFSSQVFETGFADSFFSRVHVAVLEMPLAHPAYTQQALHTIGKIRNVSPALPVVCVASEQPKADVAARIRANKAICVVGDHSVHKFLGKHSVASALRETSFKWYARNLTTATPDALANIPMTIRLVGNRPRGGTIGTTEFTPWHTKLLSHLSGGHFCGRQYLFDKMYEDDENPPGMKIIDVQICKVNALLRAGNIPPIEKIWGIGRRWPVNLMPDCQAPGIPVFASDFAQDSAPALV